MLPCSSATNPSSEVVIPTTTLPNRLRRAHELDHLRTQAVTHRLVDVEDRRVLAVVVGADLVDAQDDRLHHGLALERARDAASSSCACHTRPVRRHHAALRWIVQEGDAEDRITLARDPHAVLVNARR